MSDLHVDSYTVTRKFLEELLAHVEDGHVFGSERALMAGRIQAVLDSPSGPSHKLVAYGWRSLRDGSYGDKIAPINYAMHERNMEKLRNDPWVKNGAAEIVPLYADCSSATHSEGEKT